MYADPNNGLFHSYQKNPANPDPITYMYHDYSPNNNINEYDSLLSQYTTITRDAHSYRAIQLNANTTHSAVAIIHTPFDLSTLSAKEMLSVFDYSATTGNPTGTAISFGWFITTNNTVPFFPGYNPINDKSVSLVSKFVPQGANVFLNVIDIQLRQGESINAEDTGACQSVGPCFLTSIFTNDPILHITEPNLVLNFTSGDIGGPLCNGSQGGSQCSYTFMRGTANSFASVRTVPQFNFQAQQFYLGFFLTSSSVPISVAWSFESISSTPVTCGAIYAVADGCNQIDLYVPTVNSNQPPTVDTGGFFGPIIKALISIGVFILNGTLQFISFITPALTSALNFLESIVVTVLNAIGNTLGFGNLGDDLATLLNSIIAFFTNTSYGLPAFILKFPSYFANFLSWLQIVFPFIGPAFTIANGILAVGVNGIIFAINVLSFGTGLVTFGYAMLLIFAYFIFTADDAIGGLLTFLGTAEALAFKLLNLVALLVNLGIDIVVMIVGLIPKPMIQSNAAYFPRLPTITTSASITMPRMDFAELRNGNLISVWLWTMGFWFDAWYESHNPALPGSVAALIPATATNMQLLSTLLPLLQVFVFISGGTMLFWIVMRPLALLGADLGIFETIGIGLGSHQGGTGPGGIGVKGGTRHLRKGLREQLERKRVGILGSRSQNQVPTGPREGISALEQATA